MRTSLATRISGLLQQILMQTGGLRAEMRRLDQAGHGHPRMREICDLLDSLDSSIHWDLHDELHSPPGLSSLQATRILNWLGADIEPLDRQLSLVGEQCRGHPLATVASLACVEIVALYRDIEDALGPTAFKPVAGPGAVRTWGLGHSAAESVRLC